MTIKEMPIHLSVQANAVNWATVKFWQQMGLTRVILSRELSLEETEVGLRGGQTATRAVSPDVAIVLDTACWAKNFDHGAANPVSYTHLVAPVTTVPVITVMIAIANL